MTVTEVAPQKKHLNRVEFSDGSFLLLDKDTCAENGVYEDAELSLEQIEDLRYKSEFQRAKSRALWCLDRMDYSEKKLFEKLILAGFDKKVAAAVLAKLVETGLVDDRRFAERLAEKLIAAGVSKREALAKMLYRGIGYDLAKEILSNCEIDEQSQLSAVIEKKYAGKLLSEDGYKKVYAALIRKGFSYGEVSAALKKYKNEEDYV